MKIIKKIKDFFNFLQSLPYEKRVYLLQVSIILVGLIGFLLWISLFSTQINNNNKITLDEQNKAVPTKFDVFKKGIYVVYQDYILPLLGKISHVFLALLSFSVKLVIKMFNFASHFTQQIFMQYKSYAQLIKYFFF